MSRYSPSPLWNKIASRLQKRSSETISLPGGQDYSSDDIPVDSELLQEALDIWFPSLPKGPAAEGESVDTWSDMVAQGIHNSDEAFDDIMRNYNGLGENDLREFFPSLAKVYDSLKSGGEKNV